MTSVIVDRGMQLDGFRQEHILTDVVIKSSSTSIPCHKLLLSLYSPYFRTLFQSTGFIESGQNTIELTHIKPELLKDIICFMYSGRLELKNDCENVADILEVASMLQLHEPKLLDLVKSILSENALRSEHFQELYYLWNTAVTYDLLEVVETILYVIDIKLEEFMTSAEDISWLCMLGWEELKQILDRPNLCVNSEATLVKLVTLWGSDKVRDTEEFAEWLLLFQSVRFTLLDKKYVKQQMKESFPLFSDIKPRQPLVKLPRHCQRCMYIIQYKLTKSQIRNIEDFIDKGERSLFLGFSFGDWKSVKLTCLTSMGSMIGTASGNYSRPITTGSRMFQYKNTMLIVGGLIDSDPEKVRTDILVYSTETKCWMTSLKQYIRQRSRAVLLEIVQVDTALYLIWGQSKRDTTTAVHQNVMKALLDSNFKNAVIERLDMRIACEDGKVEKEVVSELPIDLCHCEIACVNVLGNIYFVTEGSTWMFNTAHSSWIKLPPPIGSISSNKPVLTFSNPYLYMVGGRHEDSTNSVQVMDVMSNTWKRLPNLNTRLTPIDMFCHCGEIYVVGWQPARNNFVLSLNKDSGEGTVIVEGLEGIWSSGLVGRGDQFQSLLERRK